MKKVIIVVLKCIMIILFFGGLITEVIRLLFSKGLTPQEVPFIFAWIFCLFIFGIPLLYLTDSIEL